MPAIRRARLPIRHAYKLFGPSRPPGVILRPMSKPDPAWLPETRQFCQGAGIPIVGWGPNLLTVEARGKARAQEITSQLGSLGFQPIDNAGNRYAGLLDLSKDPAALREQIHNFDVTKPCWQDSAQPLIWALGALLLIPWFSSSDPREPYWMVAPLGLGSLAMFVYEALRIWGYRAEFSSDALRVRRYFRWKEIPWDRVLSVHTKRSSGRSESVTLMLVPRDRDVLGTFFGPFASALRDRIATEVHNHHNAH